METNTQKSDNSSVNLRDASQRWCKDHGWVTPTTSSNVGQDRNGKCPVCKSRVYKSAGAKRGFAALPKEQVSAIARRGGKAAHASGTAHEFTQEEARIAGRKGGKTTHAKRRAEKEALKATASVAVLNSSIPRIGEQ